jgi:hypothetical protein
LTSSQFFIGLANKGYITLEEAVSADTVGTIPQSIQTIINTLNDNEKLEIQIKWARMTNVERNSRLVDLLQEGFNLTKEEMNSFFYLSSKI